MKVFYRGYEIEVRRELSRGGDLLIYYSVYSVAVGERAPCLADGFESSDDSVQSYVDWLKARVDDYYLNPEDYE